uniref:CCHC-type domain-containing protein n=1 Tax=Panagrellus redivivus TaxID=6233 RepID=A0A7E4UP13_PANRE
MSEPLRKTLEKAVERLYKYIAEYSNEIAAKSVDLTDKSAADAYLEHCNHIYGKLKQTVNEVNNYKQRWERIIAQTPNPVARKAEDDLFTAWSNKEQNFIDGAELAYDIMDSLQKASRTVKMEIPAPQNDNLEDMDEHDGIASNAQDTGYDMIRLPQIEIPTFNGSLEEWPTFNETFMETIHKNRKLPNVLKLTHLMRCLSGDAAKVVAGYPTIGINYPIVWNALKERFGNREQLLNQLNSKLLKLPTCHSEDPRELRKAYDEMARVTRILTAQNIDCNNSQVTTIIETKLPPAVLHELYKTKHEQQIDEWTIDHLLDEINKIVTLKETVNRAMQTHRDSSYNGVRTYEKFGKASQNVLATQHMTKTPRTPCILCGGQHWNDKCIVYKTVSSRMDRLKEMRRCFTCLQEGHMTKQCQRRAFCRACNGTHSSVLCRKTVDMDNPKMNTMEQRRLPELAYPQRQQQRTPRPHPTTGGNAAPIGQRQTQNNALTVQSVTTGVNEAVPALEPKSSILSFQLRRSASSSKLEECSLSSAKTAVSTTFKLRLLNEYTKDNTQETPDNDKGLLGSVLLSNAMDCKM